MRYTPQEHFVERRHHRRFPHREDFPRLACRLVGEILDKPNLRLIGCKTPNFAERYRSGEIEAVFPNTRLLFIVRNPRDIVNSSLNRRNLTLAGEDVWNIATANEAVAECRRTLQQIVALLHAHGERSYVVKYEDLCADEGTVLAGVSRFLGLELTPTGLPNTTWRPPNVMTDEESAIFEAEFGPLSAAWRDLRLTGPANAARDALSCVAAVVSPEQPALVAEGHAGVAVLGAGWSAPEPYGCWSEAECATLIRRGPGEGPVYLGLVVHPFLPPGGLRLRLLVDNRLYFDGLVVEGLVANASGRNPGLLGIADMSRPHTLWLGPMHLRADGGASLVELQFPGVAPASDYGSEDSRRLGLQLSGVQVLSLATQPSRSPVVDVYGPEIAVQADLSDSTQGAGLEA